MYNHLLHTYNNLTHLYHIITYNHLYILRNYRFKTPLMLEIGPIILTFVWSLTLSLMVVSPLNFMTNVMISIFQLSIFHLLIAIFLNPLHMVYLFLS